MHLFVLERGDFDGDGVEDELVLTSRDCLCWTGEGSVSNEAGAAVALLRRAGGCTWAGTADGSVEFVCSRPARRALLRWDEARFELVPDRPPMPSSSSERW